jgi:alanine racemase
MAGKVQLLAVVKANAYGHGAVPVARALEAVGIAFLGVATIEEGLELRGSGVRAPILVMGGCYEGAYDQIVEHQLTPIVFRPEHLAGLGRAAKARQARVKIHLKVDTGMGRIGVLPEELDEFVSLVGRYPEISVDGLASHFASADLADAKITAEQVQRFQEAAAALTARGIRPSWKHLANSAGVIDHRGLDLNLVRPGLMLYGVAPAPWLSERVKLQPVLTWKTAVVHLKRVRSGTPISYGSTWRAPRESLIATLPVGYADGYARSLSNKASVLIRGRRAPVVGRVCMDMIMVDVTSVPGAEMGDEVVLLGRQGEERVSAEELANILGTIPYEVLCAVGARVPRETVGG